MIWDLVVYTFIASFVVILFYYLYFFSRLLGDSKKGDGKWRSASFIVCARNDGQNLRENLHIAVDQDYDELEVILVDDGSTDETTEIMQSIAAQFDYVKYHRLDIDKSKYPGKKYALQYGIHQASNEIIVVADADCKPVNKHWIKSLLEMFDDQTDLVLGYGPYYKHKGVFNAMARYECIYTAIKYLSFARAGIPYMGVGRNMAYRKQVFIDNGGFDSHMHVPSGDDDLFVREIAKPKNTKVVTAPNTQMWSEPALSWKAFVRQKHRHLSVGFYYKPLLKYLLGLDLMSIYLFHFSLIALLISNKLTFPLICIIICKVLIHTILFGVIYRKFKSNLPFVLTPIVDLLHLISYFYISIKVLINKTVIWR